MSAAPGSGGAAHNAVFTANTAQAQKQMHQLATEWNKLLTNMQKSSGSLVTQQGRLIRTQQQQARATNQSTRAVQHGGRAFAGFAQHSAQVNKQLLRTSSAASGVLLGFSLLTRNVLGAGLGLIFLRFNILSVTGLFVALTVAIGLTAKALKTIVSNSIAAGRALETTGQRLASFFRSADLAQKILTQADEITRKFGTARDDVLGMLDALEKVGLRSDAYIKSILNASAATGKSVGDVSEQFTALLRADASERENLMNKFIRDFDLPAKKYASTLELATALNERFNGSVEAMAGTTDGILSRLRASMTSLFTSMGAIMIETFKAILEPLRAFADGMVQGFGAAKDAADATGELNRHVEGLRALVRRLVPMMSILGRLIGRGLFAATMLAVRGMKLLYSAILIFTQFLKNLRGNLPITTQYLKEFFNPFAANAPKVAAIMGFLRGFITEILPKLGRGRLPSFNLGALFSGGLPTINLSGWWSKIVNQFRPRFAGQGLGGRIVDGILETLDAGVRGARGLPRIALRIATALVEEIPRAIRGIGGIGAKIWGALGEVLAGAGRLPRALLHGLFVGVKAGIVFALIELFTLGAVDMLPISDSLKQSLKAVIGLTFTAAGIGFFFGGVGALIAGGLALAIFGGLEIIAPGTAAKIQAWLDETVKKGFIKLGEFFKTEVVPALREFSGWVRDDGAPRAREFGQTVATWMQPKIEAFSKFLKDDLQPALNRFGDWFVEDFLPDAKAFALYVNEHIIQKVLIPLGVSVAGLVDGALRDLWDFLLNSLWPEVKKFAQDIWPELEPILKDWGKITEEVGKFIIEDLLPALAELTTRIIDDVLPPIQDLLFWIAEKLVPIALVVLRDTVKEVTDKFKFLGQLFTGDFKGAALTLLDDVLSPINLAIDLFNLTLGPAFKKLWEEIKPVLDPVSVVLGNIKDVLSWIVDHTTLSIRVNFDWLEPPKWVKDAWKIFTGGLKWPGSGGGGQISYSGGANINPSGTGLPTGDDATGDVPGNIGQAFGGTIKGPRGSRRWVLAEAGEQFMGAPAFAQARGSAGAQNRGGNTTIHLGVTVLNPVMTDMRTADRYAEQTARAILGRLGASHKISIHKL